MNIYSNHTIAGGRVFAWPRLSPTASATSSIRGVDAVLSSTKTGVLHFVSFRAFHK